MDRKQKKGEKERTITILKERKQNGGIRRERNR